MNTSLFFLQKYFIVNSVREFRIIVYSEVIRSLTICVLSTPLFSISVCSRSATDLGRSRHLTYLLNSGLHVLVIGFPSRKKLKQVGGSRGQKDSRETEKAKPQSNQIHSFNNFLLIVYSWALHCRSSWSTRKCRKNIKVGNNCMWRVGRKPTRIEQKTHTGLWQ